MYIKNRDFFHFGTLPQICIHSLDEDEYSPKYKPNEICECGCDEWIESEMKIVKDLDGYEFPKKRVHRCKQCNEVRIAKLIDTDKALKEAIRGVE